MSGTNYFFDYAETEDGFIITLKDVGNFKDIKYFRINLRHEDVGTNPVITVDEEIVYAQVGFLDDGINLSKFSSRCICAANQPHTTNKRTIEHHIKARCFLK